MTNNILYFSASKFLIISNLTFAFPISPYSLSFYICFDNIYSISTLNVFLYAILQPVPSDFPPHKFFIINLKMVNILNSMTNNILYFSASKFLIISNLTFAFPISPYSLSFYICFDNIYSISTLNVFLYAILQPVPSDFPPHKFFIINLKMVNILNSMTNTILYFFASKFLILSNLTFTTPKITSPANLIYLL